MVSLVYKHWGLSYIWSKPWEGAGGHVLQTLVLSDKSQSRERLNVNSTQVFSINIIYACGERIQREKHTHLEPSRNKQSYHFEAFPPRCFLWKSLCMNSLLFSVDRSRPQRSLEIDPALSFLWKMPFLPRSSRVTSFYHLRKHLSRWAILGVCRWNPWPATGGGLQLCSPSPAKGCPSQELCSPPHAQTPMSTAWWHLWVSVPGTQRRRNVFESLHLRVLFRLPTDTPCSHLHLETVFILCAVPSGLLLGSFIYIQDAWSHVYRGFGGVCF